LAKPPGNRRARFEFRDVLNNRFTIAAIHNYAPFLPWYFYSTTQALIHLSVMKAYQRHLAKLANRWRCGRQFERVYTWLPLKVRTENHRWLPYNNNSIFLFGTTCLTKNSQSTTLFSVKLQEFLLQPLYFNLAK
jgi:hypothetical protein